MQSKQQNNPRIVADLISSIMKNKSKQHIMAELSTVDGKLSQIYANVNQAKFRSDVAQQLMINTASSLSPHSHLYSTNNKIDKQMSSTVMSLGIPKNNSLTDSLLRSTLGCEQKLAKSYLQILDKSQQIEEQQKQKRVNDAKQRFAQSNKYKDIYANSRSTLHNTYNYTYHEYHNFDQRVHPVIDNQHDSYLKTQLMYLQKPKAGKKVNERQYYDKHVDNITKKIKQIGGMEDTVGGMQDTLGKYELRNAKKRGVYAGWTGNNFNSTNNPYRNNSGISQSEAQSMNSWTDRSKAIRQALMTKINIQQ